MKRIQQLLSVLIVTGALIVACTPEAHKDLGEPRNNIDAISGSWKLTKVLQTDEDATRKGFPFKQADLTNVFPYTDFKMTLNTNNGVPSTFTTTPGNSPKIIKLASGNWTVDDPDYPKLITMVNGTDTQRVTLGAYPIAGINPSLKIRHDKRDASGKLLISYSYEFTKQ